MYVDILNKLWDKIKSMPTSSLEEEHILNNVHLKIMELDDVENKRITESFEQRKDNR